MSVGLTAVAVFALFAVAAFCAWVLCKATAVPPEHFQDRDTPEVDEMWPG